MERKLTKLIASLLSAALLVSFIACDTAPTPSTTEITTTETTETTVSPETTTAVTTTATEAETTTETTTAETTTAAPLPHAEAIAQAVDIAGKWPEKTLEVPLLVLIINFDADGDGVNDYDENDPEKLYRNKKDAYYGEQWAGTKPSDHFENLFGETDSLSAFYNEMTMGYFRYVPAQLDVETENAAPRGGIMSVTVNKPHNHSEKYAPYEFRQSTWFKSDYQSAVLEACSPYIDFSKFDTNGDRILSPYELGIIIMAPGLSNSKNTTNAGAHINESDPRFRFSTNGGFANEFSVSCDGVRPAMFVYQAEYDAKGNIMGYMHSAHELAHTFDARDLYDKSDTDGGGEPVEGWATAYGLSLEHEMGDCFLDPFHRIKLGWVEEHIVEDGIYTIHSTNSKEYAVLRVNTPNPDEYYLIEVRTPIGGDQGLASTYKATNGGVMVWHIDESGVSYVSTPTAGSIFNFSFPFDHSRDPRTGKLLHPVVSPLMQGGYNADKSLIIDARPADPFYYSDESGTREICDTGDFHSYINGNSSLYQYPSNWKGEKDFNIRIEVLSAPGDDMTVRIAISTTTETGDSNTLPPDIEVFTVSCENGVAKAVCEIKLDDGAIVKRHGIMFSTSEDFSENTQIQKIGFRKDQNGNTVFRAVFSDLKPNTTYYYKAFVETVGGYAEKIVQVNVGAFSPVLASFPQDFADPEENRLHMECRILDLRGATIKGQGIMLSTSKDFSENVQENGHLYQTDDGSLFIIGNFYGMKSDTRYYIKAFVESDGGYVETVTISYVFNPSVLCRVKTVSETNDSSLPIRFAEPEARLQASSKDDLKLDLQSEILLSGDAVLTNAKIKRCSFVISTSADFTENKKVNGYYSPSDGKHYVTGSFKGLTHGTTYYVKAYIECGFGYVERISTVRIP